MVCRWRSSFSNVFQESSGEVMGDAKGDVAVATVVTAVSTGVADATGVLSETGDGGVASVFDFFLSLRNMPKQTAAAINKPPTALTICFLFQFNFGRSFTAGADGGGPWISSRAGGACEVLFTRVGFETAASVTDPSWRSPSSTSGGADTSE